MKNISNKKKINELERKLAKKYGMDKTLQSGGNILTKGDMKDDYFMVDWKTTEAKTQITLKKNDIIKCYNDAAEYSMPKIPVLGIRIDDFECFVISPEDFNHYRKLVVKSDELDA